jgi:hypothetical protein
MNEGKRWKKKPWSTQGRTELCWRTSPQYLQEQLEYFLHGHDRGKQWHHGDQTSQRKI